MAAVIEASLLTTRYGDLTAEEYLQFVTAVRAIDAWSSCLDFAGQRDMLCKDSSRGTRRKQMFAAARCCWCPSPGTSSGMPRSDGTDGGCPTSDHSFQITRGNAEV